MFLTILGISSTDSSTPHFSKTLNNDCQKGTSKNLFLITELFGPICP
jgi:hypothetical protein